MSDEHSHRVPDDVVRQRVKAELRKRMRAVRKTTPMDAILARSRKIADALLEHEAIKRARTVALFWPIEARHEVDLRPLDTILRTRGARIAYPSIDQDTNEMTFRWVPDPSAMDEHGKGFREPTKDAPEVGAFGPSLDVIVVPALAVDPSGFRIGYGAAYYDLTLPRFSPPAVKIAVAFDWQLIAEVPREAWDVAVDFVVTDTRAFAAAK